MFRRIANLLGFGDRKQLDVVSSDNYEEMVTYIAHLISEEIFKKYEQSDKLRSFISSSYKTIDEILTEMGWETEFMADFTPILLNSIKSVCLSVDTSDTEIKYKLDGITQKDEETFKKLAELHPLFLAGVEDLVDLIGEAITQQMPTGSINNPSIGVVWNSFFNDNFFSHMQNVMVDEMFIHSTEPANILIIGHGNEDLIEIVLQTLLNNKLSGNVHIVESSPVLMNLTRRSIDYWLSNNASTSDLDINVHYFQHEFNDIDKIAKNLNGVKFDQIYGFFTLQYLRKEEREGFLEKLNDIKNETGVILISNLSGNSQGTYSLEPIFANGESVDGFPAVQTIEQIGITIFNSVETLYNDYIFKFE